jgi:hypothetical protein
MGCCGQKRAALTSAPPAAVRRPSPNLPTATSHTPIAGRQVTAPTRSAQPLPIHSSVALRYTETSPILVRGPVTGRQYQFSGSQLVHAVDARDVAALLRTGFFRQS